MYVPVRQSAESGLYKKLFKFRSKMFLGKI